MRKVVLCLAALAAFGIAMPAVSGSADAREVVVIKKKEHRHWDRGRHEGWYHREGWHHHHHGDRVVIRAN